MQFAIKRIAVSRRKVGKQKTRLFKLKVAVIIAVMVVIDCDLCWNISREFHAKSGNFVGIQVQRRFISNLVLINSV